MPSFIFLCNIATERECLDRKLFGTNDSLRQGYNSLAPGDRLFLYNFDSGSFRGPFHAATKCAFNMEPRAWKGKFRWQVRIDDSSAFPIPLTADDLAKRIKLTPLPPPEIDDAKTEAIMSDLRSKNGNCARE